MIVCTTIFDSDSRMREIATWPTGGQTLQVNVTGTVAKVIPATGTPGVLYSGELQRGDVIHDLRPTAGVVFLSNCTFERAR